MPPFADPPFDIGDAEASLTRMVEDFARLGDTYRVYAPSRRAEVWVIHSPDDVKRVLVTNHENYTKGFGLDRVKLLLGNGIMVSEGEFWRRQRRMMQPLFSRRAIEQFARLIVEANTALIERWERKCAAGEPVDVTQDTSELILGIVLSSIFGRDLAWMTECVGANPFELLTQMPKRDLRFAFRFRALSRLVTELIQRRRAAPEDHLDFVAMLMGARDKETGASMSDRELVDELLTLIVAGHETTAAAVNVCWYLLSQHPHAEAELHAEVDAVPERPCPSYRDIDDLPVTQRVLQESMRLYPPGWLLSRRAIGADRIGGYDLPAGTTVLLAPYLVHRHPRHWDAPEEFRPDRFLPEAVDQRHKQAYLPFAAGPRHCIGENVAMFEMTLHVAMVARRFRLRHLAEQPLEFEAGVNLRTRHHLMYRLETR